MRPCSELGCRVRVSASGLAGCCVSTFGLCLCGFTERAGMTRSAALREGAGSEQSDQTRAFSVEKFGA